MEVYYDLVIRNAGGDEVARRRFDSEPTQEAIHMRMKMEQGKFNPAPPLFGSIEKTYALSGGSFQDWALEQKEDNT